MMLSHLPVVALAGLAVFAAICGIYNLLRAVQAREQLITQTEDLAADPQVLSDPLRRRSFLVRWADRYDRSPAGMRTRELLRRACLDMRPSDYRVLRLAASAALAYVGLILLKIPPLPSLLLGLALYVVGPRLLFAFRRDAYVKKFNTQLIEVTQILANGLRAGMSIQQGMNQVAERMPEPSRGEFRQACNELLLGDNLVMALNGMRGRVGSRELDVVVSAILVQHQAGGNLARVLGAMSHILTERERLAGEIKTMTADARVSAMIVQIIPIGLLVLLRDTPFGQGLFETIPGWVLLVVYGSAQIGILLLIRRILRIEI